MADGYNTQNYEEQGGTSWVVGGVLRINATGELRLDASGHANFASGRVTLPGTLRQGTIPLKLTDCWEAASADSLNALTSGTNPALGRINAGTDPKTRIRWASGTGASDPVQWDTDLPTDLATAFPLKVNLYGERTSGTTNALDVRVFFGVGDVNAGSSVALTSAPAYATVEIASGDILANTPLSIIVSPQSVSGNVDLYGARLVYTRLTS